MDAILRVLENNKTRVKTINNANINFLFNCFMSGLIGAMF